nr:reverse transcriptase domain-containing protein [Tanacetum cinerariifolium]
MTDGEFTEEIDTYLKDESISPEIDHADCDPKGDICLIEKLLNDDPFQLPPIDLKQGEVVKAKSLIEEPPELELKELPSHLKYAYLEGVDKLPVIISKDLKVDEKKALLKVLKSHKKVIAWKITDIKRIDPRFCTHKILMEEDYKPAVQSQRRVNPKIHEDQPYAKDASPIVQSPEYVLESDLEAHPEDDDDEDPKEDPVDYLAGRGNDGDDEDGPSEDDKDDDMDIEANEEEEEHPDPVESVVVASTATDQAPSEEETEPFETNESAATPPPHPTYRMTARISIPALVPMPAWSDSEIVRLLAMSSPPASPLSLWSSPPPRIPFPPLPPILSPPSPVLSPAPPPSPIRSLGYRAAMIRLRDEAASTSSPLLQLPSTSRKEDRPEVTLPPRKKLGIALGPRYEVGKSSSAAAARPAGGLRADYGFVATMDREIMRDPEREVGYGITDSWDEIVEALQGAPGLAGGPTQLELPEEAGSGS